MHDVINGGGLAASVVIVQPSSEPLWTDVAGFWVGVAVAATTLFAVGVSIWLARRGEKRERTAFIHAHAPGLFELLAEAKRGAALSAHLIACLEIKPQIQIEMRRVRRSSASIVPCV
jgi:hypothetical protein